MKPKDPCCKVVPVPNTTLYYNSLDERKVNHLMKKLECFDMSCCMLHSAALGDHQLWIFVTQVQDTHACHHYCDMKILHCDPLRRT